MAMESGTEGAGRVAQWGLRRGRGRRRAQGVEGREVHFGSLKNLLNWEKCACKQIFYIRVQTRQPLHTPWG